jgi:hypothetical protein
MQSFPLNTQFAPTHRVAADRSGFPGDQATAGQTEVPFEVRFGCGPVGEAVGTLKNFDDAFLALALFSAGGWNVDAQGLRAFKQSGARGDERVVVVKMQLYAHAGAFIFTCEYDNPWSGWTPDLIRVLN